MIKIVLFIFACSLIVHESEAQTAVCSPTCLNGGVCISLGGVPTCACASPYFGTSCQNGGAATTTAAAAAGYVVNPAACNPSCANGFVNLFLLNFIRI